MTAVAPEISIGRGFVASANELALSDRRRVQRAVDRFRANPDHPSLNFHRLASDPSRRLYTFRASQELRVLVAREGGVFVLLEAGHHDDVYDRARRGRFVVSEATGFVGFVGDGIEPVHAPPSTTRSAGPPADDGPRPFDHWSDAELADVGFAADEIERIRRVRYENQLFDVGLDDQSIEQLIEMLEVTPEQWRNRSLFDAAGLADERPENRLRTAIEEFGAYHGLSPLFGPDKIARLASAPIEEWMIFLHPDQRAIVDHRYEGPARVRGAAGTGKTVVALHRAAVLARRFREDGERGRILFTTYIRSLPPVFEALYQRLPTAVKGAVEFVNIHKLAYRICTAAGRRPITSGRDIDAAYARAYQQVVRPGTPLRDARLSRSYLRDEITAVVKGRGITSLDLYLGLDRTGRQVRFTEPMRRQLWDLREVWDAEMARRGTVDFADVILAARDIVRERPRPAYRAAIVDESQDLTLVGLQLVRALVNGPGGDRPDGLLIVGDGAQRIYPGGFTLRQAGVEVAGRATVLRANYRNTAEILDAAMAVAGDEPVDDLGEEYQRADAEVDAVRAGGMRPTLVACASPDDECVFLLQTIQTLAAGTEVGYGDIGVFAATNREVDALLERMRAASVPALSLEQYTGETVEQVKVGTFHRAKGLEFKVVFLPGLSAGRFPRTHQPGQPDHEYAEERARQISQLFVAMTRARDGLFVLFSGEPSDVLADHLDRFDLVESG